MARLATTYALVGRRTESLKWARRGLDKLEVGENGPPETSSLLEPRDAFQIGRHTRSTPKRLASLLRRPRNPWLEKAGVELKNRRQYGEPQQWKPWSSGHCHTLHFGPTNPLQARWEQAGSELAELPPSANYQTR
jgi:hypothetical protein